MTCYECNFTEFHLVREKSERGRKRERGRERGIEKRKKKGHFQAFYSYSISCLSSDGQDEKASKRFNDLANSVNFIISKKDVHVRLLDVV